MADLSSIFPLFKAAIQDSPIYAEALDLVRKNSSGKIWLVGGFLSRNITYQLYGREKPDCDVDFIVEELLPLRYVPPGWIERPNAFGNPKFLKQGQEIDCVPLRNIYSIQRRGLTPTIENYLTGTPFTPQSLAYSVEGDCLLGEIGAHAIRKRIFAVNDLEEAKHSARIKGKSLVDLMREKAESMGFRASP